MATFACDTLELTEGLWVRYALPLGFGIDELAFERSEEDVASVLDVLCKCEYAVELSIFQTFPGCEHL